MPKPYSQGLRDTGCEARRSRSFRGGPRRLISGVSASFVINRDDGLSAWRGNLAPKRLGGRRHAKLDPHREFLLRRVAEKDDITMPELAGELAAVCRAKVDSASISRWLIRNGYRFKKTLLASECDRPDIRQAREEWRTERQPRMGPGKGWSSSTRPEPPRK